MRFARVVFLVAGVWGIAVLTPLYFLVDLTGRQYAAPADYPQFFYGFLSVAMAWQIAFLVIGRNPVRYRPLMIPGIVEKLGHVAGVAVLYGRGRLSVADATSAGPDLLLAVLFIAAFAMTPKAASDFGAHDQSSETLLSRSDRGGAHSHRNRHVRSVASASRGQEYSSVPLD